MSAMLIFLEVRSGSQLGRKIRLVPGHPVRIGRTSAADVFFSDDAHMSGLHFSIESVDNQCHISDLNSRNGCFVNGKRIATAVLTAGDKLVAGETEFALVQEAAEPAKAEAVAATAPTAEMPAFVPPQPQTPHDRLLAHLRDDFQPLYAILDAAHDIRILALLLTYKEECQSLYEGEQGAKLAQVAPYLVRLQKDSKLIEALVKEGWGKSWGVYLTSASNLQEVRHHLRHFLQVKLPSGEQVYFRFYDPRVMRVFLPTCTPEDVTQFFGPIQNYLVEDENPKKLFRFVNTGKGSERMMIALADEVEPSAEAAPDDAAPETATWQESPLKDEAS